MFQNKMDVLLFLLYIGVLIFAEKIFDNHHAYNRYSEITHINLVTCLNITLINKLWRSIVLAIKKSTYLALSNKFPKYKAERNVVKMNRRGKYE